MAYPNERFQPDQHQSPQSEDCRARMAQEWFTGVSNGSDQRCLTDGTLVRDRATDYVGRATVAQKIAPDGSQVFSLERQGVTISLNKEGQLQAFSDANHIYSFDPQKQIDAKAVGSLDIGHGVTESRDRNGDMTFQFPDGGPRVAINQHGRVTEIAQDGKYQYQFSSKHISEEDHNLPEDARVTNPLSIQQDASRARTAENPWADGRWDEQRAFAKSVASVPEDRRLEYVKAIKAELDEREKDERSGFRKTLNIEQTRDGHLKSVTVGDNLYIPLFSPDNVVLYEQK